MGLARDRNALTRPKEETLTRSNKSRGICSVHSNHHLPSLSPAMAGRLRIRKGLGTGSTNVEYDRLQEDEREETVYRNPVSFLPLNIVSP